MTFPLLAASIEWLPMDTWIVVVGALSAMSCALLGNYLVLRRMSMMGDAISHAVLPGLAVAFLVTGSRGSVAMLIGAGVTGVLTAVFTQWIHTVGRVEQSASMGVVFTALFATGLVLIRQAADRVDLDPDCVLYGAIETVPLFETQIFGLTLPQAALTAGAVFLLNAAFVAAFYKELKISSFDPALATTLGIHATLMHYLLMTLVAMTTVAAFESVGSILVIAMLIVPPAAAHLLTDRLGVMIGLSLGIAASAAGLGHVAAIVTPAWFGFEGGSASTAGMMGVVAGGMFTLAMLFGPRHGVLSRLLNRASLTVRIVREDMLALLERLEEVGAANLPAPAAAIVRDAIPAGPLAQRLALWSLARRGHVSCEHGELSLTAAGRAAAQALLRSHRLWETYLEKHLRLPADHLHGTAERLEHVTDAALRERLAESLGNPTQDPHGKAIPPGA